MALSRHAILFFDAYDSFSENIISLLRALTGQDVDTIKIDTDIPKKFGVSEDEYFQRYYAIVLGPGPGDPLNVEDVGLYRSVWSIAARHHIPVLGICLGFQSLCAHYGLEITRLPMPCHGHARAIRHASQDMFATAGSVVATCYNSMGVRLQDGDVTPPFSRPASSDSEQSQRADSHRDSLDLEHARPQNDLDILAWDNDGWVQAVRHQNLPFHGLQFHPESCKSNLACHDVLLRWWQQTRHINEKQRPAVPLQKLSDPCLTSQNLASTSTQPSMLDTLRATTKSTAVCHFKCLELRIDRRHLARLCFDLSNKDSISMLESAKKGRYSIYAISDATSWTLEYMHRKVILKQRQRVEECHLGLREALQLVEDFMLSQLTLDGPAESPFWGGLIGYMSYELGLDLLDITDPLEPPSPRQVPDYSLMWVDRSIVVDKDTSCIYVQSLRPNDDIWLHETTKMIHGLTQPPSKTSTSLQASIPPPKAQLSTPDHANYISQIAACQSHLHAGNSYELCLTTSTTLPLPNIHPFTLHQHLQSHNPAPYSALLQHPSATILSSSPEQFLSWTRPTISNPNTELHMCPMKGTLAKTPSMTPTIALAQLSTPKEEAENLMIVDLIRHDLHRALGPNAKVDVVRLFELVEAETVFQLISHIRGTTVPPPLSIPSPSPPPTTSSGAPSSSAPLHNAATTHLRHIKREAMHAAFSALRHTLPPGSMTGAPKKRSCAILRGLERRNRGVYAGVIGYFDVGGGGAWSVAIRCAFAASTSTSTPISAPSAAAETQPSQTQKPQKDADTAAVEKPLRQQRKWHVGAGGAITVLSEPEAEWEEMRVKMESVLRGFRM
jgi:para-aminobenzoate synthetase